MTLRVPVIASNQPNWNRDAASAINRLINDTSTNATDIAAINAAIPHTPPVTVTADATIAATDRWIINNKAGSACVLTLPAAASFSGRELHIKTIQAQAVNSVASDVVPLGGGAAGTVIVSNTAGRWVTLVSDGTNWVAMAGVI